MATNPHAPRIGTHRREVERDDRRMLLVWSASFAAVLGLFAAGTQVYRVTGPHPEVTALIRQMKHHARWLIPGLKGAPNAKDAPF
jgi:hypothetical protein